MERYQYQELIITLSPISQVVYIKHDGQDLPLRKSLIERSSQYELDLSQELNITCPVTILHGVKDQSVSFMVISTHSSIFYLDGFPSKSVVKKF